MSPDSTGHAGGESQTPKAYIHDAFISYSRKDREFAARLEKALEGFKPPRDLKVPHRHLDIFRDEVDFTGTEYYTSCGQTPEGVRTAHRGLFPQRAQKQIRQR